MKLIVVQDFRKNCLLTLNQVVKIFLTLGEEVPIYFGNKKVEDDFVNQHEKI